VILRAANLTVARHNNVIAAQHENLIIVQHDNLLAAGKAGRISWSGNFTWNPDANEQDREHRNALAARSYWLAFQAVQKSLRRVLRGENPGTVAEEDHGAWYRKCLHRA
jgi:hypothetical protein